MSKDERTRTLNMIGAQRARIFIKLGQIADKLDFTVFRKRASVLFSKIASILTETQAQNLCHILLKYLKRREGSQSVASIAKSKVQLIRLFEDFVWNESKIGRLGRPNSTIDDYFQDSETKIADWRH